MRVLSEDLPRHTHPPTCKQHLQCLLHILLGGKRVKGAIVQPTSPAGCDEWCTACSECCLTPASS
jgi:hypothetical protein